MFTVYSVNKIQIVQFVVLLRITIILLLVTRNLLRRQLRVPEAMLFVRDVGCRV